MLQLKRNWLHNDWILWRMDCASFSNTKVVLFHATPAVALMSFRCLTSWRPCGHNPVLPDNGWNLYCTFCFWNKSHCIDLKSQVSPTSEDFRAPAHVKQVNTHHGDFSNFLDLPRTHPVASDFASNFFRSNSPLVITKENKISKSKSPQEMLMRSAGLNPSNCSLVRLSASTFSSRGLHLKSRDNLALARAADNCMFKAISGHLVVALLMVRASLALLSVPPVSPIERDFRHRSLSSHPKAFNATNVARSSAEVDAHWDSPEGLNKKGASSGPIFKENRRRAESSQPTRITAPSVHFKSKPSKKLHKLPGRNRIFVSLHLPDPSNEPIASLLRNTNFRQVIPDVETNKRRAENHPWTYDIQMESQPSRTQSTIPKGAGTSRHPQTTHVNHQHKSSA